jgi:GTP cyclohydrolase IB
MEDVQGQNDLRGVTIPRAGISDLRYPISITVGGSVQPTIGTFRMSVSLSADRKGTHMSRFVEILHAVGSDELISSIPHLSEHLRTRLDAAQATIEVDFPFFVKRTAPVSSAEALLEYRGHVRASCDQHGVALELGVCVPITTVCPCSKAISDYGAHNQRGTVTIVAKTAREIGLHELIDYAEASASCRVYPLVKRADERDITMRAYDHPQFVEDVVRDVSLFLQADGRVDGYSVEAVNAESIHNHSAFASAVWSRATRDALAPIPNRSVEKYG